MGFDKPDLGFVVHLGAPSSPVAYYQQVGRAGRATERADVLLLPGVEDQDIWAYFASVSMPREEQAQQVLDTLAAAGRPLSTAALETIGRRPTHPPGAAAQGARRRRCRAAGDRRVDQHGACRGPMTPSATHASQGTA
jgi:superfamily II DNA helicase RecQ